MIVVFAVLALAVSTAASGSGLSGDEKSAILKNIHAYRDAWLKGDADAVMATLANEAVILPSGLDAVVGERAIRAFWWPPDTPPTKVLDMELKVEEIAGDANVAHAWGRGSLRFSYQQDGQERVVSVRSTFLNVLRRQSDGQWKTVWRMWSDLPRK